MKLPADNLSYPVRILIGNGSGSGFLIHYKKELYLVTAKHVLFSQDSASEDELPISNELRIICYALHNGLVQKNPMVIGIQLNQLEKDHNLKKHKAADITILRIGSLNDTDITFVPGIAVLQHSEGALVQYEMAAARKFDEIEITNDVFVLGYPSSLSTSEMNQIDYDTPLVRKGIVAGKNQKNRTIVLDCPVYGGNSGGLVLEVSRPNINQTNFHLIGVVVQFVPFMDVWENKRFPQLYNTHMQNSGYSIALPVDYILELITSTE